MISNLKLEKIEYKYESYYTVNLGKYKFTMRPEEKRAFAQRLTDEKFKKIVLEKRRDDDYMASLEYAIRAESNAIIQIYGIPESGKSTIAQVTIYHLVQMLKDRKYTPEVKLTYNYADSIHEISQFGIDHIVTDSKGNERIKMSNRRLIVFQDEQSNLQGPESRSYEKQLNTLLERFRAAQVFVILCAPNLRAFSVCNTYIEAIAKDKSSRVNWGLWQVQVSNGKSKKLESTGSLIIEYLPEVEIFFEGYINEKMSDIVQLMKRRGFQGIEIPDDVIEEGVEKLLSAGAKRGVRTKEQLKSLANILGLGTSGITKVIAEIAALQFDIKRDIKKDQELELQRELDKIAEAEEEKRISNLVLKVAKELYEAFHFDDMKAASRMVTGWIIENYPNDWQKLVQHKKYYWSLAEFWQNRQSLSRSYTVNPKELVSITSDRKLLRKAFYDAIHMRYSDELLCTRASWFFIWDEDYEKDSWTIAHQARKNSIRPSTLNVYWRKHKDQQYAIANNNKIWGDAGELYLHYKILQIWEKGKKELWINSSLAIDLLCAALTRSDGVSTKLFDLELLVGGFSLAAINVKFTYVDNQSFSMSPECEHEHPYLFVIDKNTLREILIPSEKGKTHFALNREVPSQSVEDFIKSIVGNLNE